MFFLSISHQPWLNFYWIKLFFIFIEQTTKIPSCLTTQSNCFSGVRLFLQFFISSSLIKWLRLRSDLKYKIIFTSVLETKHTNDKLSDRISPQVGFELRTCRVTIRDGNRYTTPISWVYFCISLKDLILNCTSPNDLTIKIKNNSKSIGFYAILYQHPYWMQMRTPRPNDCI